METKLNLLTRTAVISTIAHSDKPLSSIQVKRSVESRMPKDLAVNYNWHEYLYFLEHLTTQGMAKQAGTDQDGHAMYEFTAKTN